MSFKLLKTTCCQSLRGVKWIWYKQGILIFKHSASTASLLRLLWERFHPLIFGSTQPSTTEYAHKLGLAFQLTNIIRDVGEDALRGRIYLPINELQLFDVKAHEILQRINSDRFTKLMQFQCDRAKGLYREAFALLNEQDKRAQKPGLMMASIYSKLLEEIEQDGFPVLNHRVSLTPLRKFWLAWRVQALGRF